MYVTEMGASLNDYVDPDSASATRTANLPVAPW